MSGSFFMRLFPRVLRLPLVEIVAHVEPLIKCPLFSCLHLANDKGYKFVVVRLAGELFFLLGEARRRWALSIYALPAISISLIPFRSYVAFLVQLSLTSSAFALGFPL